MADKPDARTAQTRANCAMGQEILQHRGELTSERMVDCSSLQAKPGATLEGLQETGEALREVRDSWRQKKGLTGPG